MLVIQSIIKAQTSIKGNAEIVQNVVGGIVLGQPLYSLLF